MQRGNELGDALRGVGSQAAVLAGVKVVLRAAEGDGEMDDATQTGDDGRAAGGILARVGHQQDIGGKAFAEIIGEVGKDAAPTLLLPLQDQTDGRQRLPAGNRGAQPLEQREPLAFVILRTACVDTPLTLGRFEGRRLPLSDGVDGLNVVVPIDKHRVRGAFGRTLCHDKRRLGGVAGDNLHRETQAAQEAANPVGAGTAVAQPFGVGPDGGEAEKGEVIVQNLGTIGLEPGIDGGNVHRSFLSTIV